MIASLDIYYNHILSQYQMANLWKVEVRDSGMNNTTRFLVGVNGDLRILRIYENHRDPDKLRFEHEILIQLQETKLAYVTPLPYPSLTGETFVTCLDGKLAAIFTYIPGERPVHTTCIELAYRMGQATAELVLSLAQLKPLAATIYPPYYELGEAYPSAYADISHRVGINPDLKSISGDMLFLLAELNAFCQHMDSVRELPKQIIHGDFSCSNVLMEAGQVVGILDFEFATWDARAMELAVCLGEYISSEQDVDLNVQAVLTGYGDKHKLTPAEALLLPELTKLRRLDVFLHFWNRYEAGLDPVEILRDQTIRSANACRYMNKNLETLMNAIQRLVV
ncbi:MAG: phosphotransferase [Gorillibacterium sp.]|nr:phosphotransferase [Gorillibacterium sp.]